MKHDENISINGFTLENIVETLTGVILVVIALFASDLIINAKAPFSVQLIPIWLFVLVLVYKGVAMVGAANRDQKQRYNDLKETAE